MLSNWTECWAHLKIKLDYRLSTVSKLFSSSGSYIFLLYTWNLFRTKLTHNEYFIFFKSGLLTTYITLKYTEGKYEKLNIFGFLISRFIRLTPQLAIFILLTTLIPLLGSGPVWNQQITPLINNCYSNWWQNLIYSQNLIDSKNMVKIFWDLTSYKRLIFWIFDLVCNSYVVFGERYALSHHFIDSYHSIA